MRVYIGNYKALYRVVDVRSVLRQRPRMELFMSMGQNRKLGKGATPTRPCTLSVQRESLLCDTDLRGLKYTY